MKIIIFLLGIIFCLLFQEKQINAQSDAINYYPLKQGNVWVYHFGSSYGSNYKLRKSVSNVSFTNGHIYYYIDNSYIRVDSLNGNLYQLFNGAGCLWSVNERMTDSLSSRLNDSARRNCGADINKCIDTNISVKFGISMRTKHFIYINSGNAGNVYARGFGIISGYGGTGQNLWGIQLLGCVINGIVYGDTSMLTGINQISSEIPDKYELSQNYPNPFNPVTKIKFDIPTVGQRHAFDTKLIIYDALGKEVQVLVNQQLSPGTYEVDFDGSNLPSGVYYYKIESGSFGETRKMILLK